jgi:hypothetical protein
VRLAFLAAAAIVLCPALPAQTPDPPAAAELPITRVALYKNGVGFFEHAGRVTGDQSVTIDFTSAQLNDVLQSLTALDLNGGRISGAGYNSTTPLEQQLKTLPLALDADPSDVDFYDAIRGARVQVAGVGPTITGRLLSIDLRPAKDKAATDDRRFVTVISDAGQVRTLELTSAVSVTLLDTGLHTDVTRYLELLAGTRNQGLRHLTILDRGTGSRDLRVSYISEVPVWKSTYRILFADEKQAADPTVTLQGWSVVDNTTGSDWINVHLDLIAGAPQSFIQPLSIPYYARRPEIGLPAEAQLAPQTHETGELSDDPSKLMTELNALAGPAAGPNGGKIYIDGFTGGQLPRRTGIGGTVTDSTGASIPNAQLTVKNSATGAEFHTNSNSAGSFFLALPQPGQYEVTASMPGFNTTRQTNIAVNAQQATAINLKLNVGSTSQTVDVTSGVGIIMDDANVQALASEGRGFTRVRRAPAEDKKAPPPPPINGRDVDQLAASSLVPQTTTAAFDDFFEYTLTDPITIRKNESAMVPILQTKLPVERVTLWSAAQPVALRALWVTNASQLTLDRGSFSIVENGSFGGEGLLDPIHPGEKRLLSYAADQAVRVDNAAGAQQHSLRSIAIAKGILTEQYRDVVERDYSIRNAAPEPRTVILEHARTGDYELSPANASKPDETTPTMYRYRVQVPAGTTVHLKVAESHAYPQTIAVDDIDDQQGKLLITMTGGDSSRLRAQLQPVLAAQQDVAGIEARQSALSDQLDKLDTEEERQRSNIQALKDTEKGSQRRFVEELGRIEDQILKLQKEDEALDAQLEAANKVLADKVQAVQFEQSLEP